MLIPPEEATISPLAFLAKGLVPPLAKGGM
jgi:hypothetical protein